MPNKSPIIEHKEELEIKKTIVLNIVEQEQYNLITNRIIDARTMREMVRDEFDGMNYETAYLTNKRAMMSYLAPKRNDDDVRINTGVTEKKIEFVLNEILGLNLQPEITAFDQDDNELDKLSQVFTDLVIRTEEMEHSEEKDIFIFMELLSQPSVFVEELWVDKEVRDPKSRKKTRIQRAERRLLQGVQVYLGDINMPDYRYNDQPYIVKYSRMTFNEGRTLLGDLDRWQYVSPGAYGNIFQVSPTLYRKGALLANEIEIFTYECYPDNECQMIVNGIPMYEVGHPLEWDWAGYNTTMVTLKPLGGDFAYGKPLTASAKTLQALDNETIRNLVRKFRQAIEPPMGVKGNKVFSRDIWSPGAMAQGVDKEMFSKLIDHQGVSQSEIEMFNIIEKKIQEFLGTDAMSALTSGARMTATQIMATQKIAIKMLGLAVLGATRLKQRLTMLRLQNILQHYTKPQGKRVNPITKKVEDAYARFTIKDASLPNGQTGKRVIQFTDRPLNQDEQGVLYAREQKAAAAGKPIEHKAVDASLLRELDLYFYANVVPKQHDSNELRQAMLTEKLTQGQIITQITGRPMKADKVVSDFENAYRETDFFEKAAPAQPGMGMPGMPEQPGQGQPGPGVGAQVKKGATAVPKPLEAPGAETMLNK